MTTYLSHLSLSGFGSYVDFFPPPIKHAGAFSASAFASSAFRTAAYEEETTLTEGTETKLVSPLVFERGNADDFDGAPGVKRLTAELSNININLPPSSGGKIPAPRQLLGISATGTLYEVEGETAIERLTGIVTEINCAPERMTLTIEQDATAPLQALIPRRLVKDFFPSADFSTISTTGDPCVIIPWGTMYKIPLPLCQRPYLHCQFQMVASANSFLYFELTDVPNYTVQAGDVLEYDLRHPLPGSQVGMDLLTTDGTLLKTTLAQDQNGYLAHPETNLDAVAVDRWYRRAIVMPGLVGKTISQYLIGCECNTTRECRGYIANARIVDRFGDLRVAIFDELTQPAPVIVYNTPPTNSVGLLLLTWYDYGPFRQPTTGSLTVHAVYRGNAAVDPIYYALLESLPGLFCIRFTSPQRDTSGGPAAISATVSSDEFGRNPARIKQFLLSNSTDGAGVPVDAASFGAASIVLDTAQIFAEGGLATQRQAIDVVHDLTFYGEQIGVNDAGEYTDTADSAALHTLNAIHMGEGEGEEGGGWENVSFAPASYRLLDQLKQLTVKAFLVQDFGGSESYAISSSRSQAVNGSIVTHECPYLAATSVDRETYYRFTRNKHASLYRAEVSAKSMELADVHVNDLVMIHCPNDPDMDTRTMLVTQRTLTAGQIAFRLRGYDPATYNYVLFPTQTTGIPPLIDFRFTIPLTPVNFCVVAALPQVASDGTVKTFVTVQADAPTQNVTELRFRGIPVGSVLFTEIPQVVTLGQVAVQATLVLEPGLTYHYECYAYNGANDPAFRYGVPAQILNQLTPGDITVPSTATLVQVRQSGTKTVEIEATFTAPVDWGTTYLYRSTVNNSASAVIIESGKKKTFHDENVVYDTTYFYWVRVADTSGNLSLFSASASLTVTRLATNDYSDGSITNVKVASISAAKITTGLLTVNPTTGGATGIHVHNAGKVRLEAMAGAPSKISFEDPASVERASISGNAGGILTVDADVGLALSSPFGIVAMSAAEVFISAGSNGLKLSSSGGGVRISDARFDIVLSTGMGALAGYFLIQDLSGGTQYKVPFYNIA